MGIYSSTDKYEEQRRSKGMSTGMYLVPQLKTQASNAARELFYFDIFVSHVFTPTFEDDCSFASYSSPNR
jgi:hypothetical protein